MKKIKVGILGGTFDPIHSGHINICQQADKVLDFDEIWIMPNGNPPHKNVSTNSGYTKHRLEMIKLAINKLNKYKICEIELETCETPRYSFETMELLIKKYPKHDFYFIIGTDSLMTLDKWKNPERLIAACKLVALSRDLDSMKDMLCKADELMALYKGHIEVLNTNVVEISSTDLRAGIHAQAPPSKHLNPAVFDYILDNKLYK